MRTRERTIKLEDKGISYSRGIRQCVIDGLPDGVQVRPGPDIFRTRVQALIVDDNDGRRVCHG